MESLLLLKQKKQEEKIWVKKHPYTFARVSAMRAKLIEKSNYHKMMKMSVSEIAEFIGEYEYKKSVDKLSVTYKGVDLIEHALNDNFVHTILKLKKISYGDLDILINAYIRRWDFYNIKTILRGIHSKDKPEYITSLLLPIGTLHKEELEALLKLNSVEDVLKKMKIIDFDEIKKAFNIYKESNNLIEIENRLDHIYFGSLQKIASRITKGGEVFREFLTQMVNVTNLKLLLKLKRSSVLREKILKYLIDEGKNFNKVFLKKMLDSSFDDLIDILRKSPYKEVFGQKDIESLVDIELELDKFLIKSSFVSWRKHPLSALAILGYMLAKEAEVRNIKTIARAKQLGLSEDFIEEKLVVIQ